MQFGSAKLMIRWATLMPSPMAFRLPLTSRIKFDRPEIHADAHGEGIPGIFLRAGEGGAEAQRGEEDILRIPQETDGRPVAGIENDAVPARGWKRWRRPGWR